MDERCPACGDFPDYCQGHGSLIGDPAGARVLEAHDDGDHTNCHWLCHCNLATPTQGEPTMTAPAATDTVRVWYMRHDNPDVGWIINDRNDMRENYNDLEARGTFEEYLDSWQYVEVPWDAWHDGDDTRIQAIIETGTDPGPTLSVQRSRLVDAIDWAAGQDARRRLGLPSEWDQQHWISQVTGVALGGHCGTAGCIAGYVSVAQLKGKPQEGEEWGQWDIILPDGTNDPVQNLARDGLGLTQEQADVLFHEDNTLDDLIDIASQILYGEDNVVRHSDGFAGY